MKKDRPRRKSGKGRIPQIAKIARGMRVVVAAVVLGAAAFGIFSVIDAALPRTFFGVRQIVWEESRPPAGMTPSVEARHARALDRFRGVNLFRVNTAHLRQRLLADPWVKTVVVSKHFPDRLTIRVIARTPAAVSIDETAQAVLRDDTGVALERGGKEYPSALPRITHFQQAAFADALALAPLLRDRPEARIDLSDPDDLQIHLDRRIIHIGGGDFSERWRRFVVIEPDLTAWGPAPLEIDLRFLDKVVVRRAGGSTATGLSESYL